MFWRNLSLPSSQQKSMSSKKTRNKLVLSQSTGVRLSIPTYLFTVVLFIVTLHHGCQQNITIYTEWYIIDESKYTSSVQHGVTLQKMVILIFKIYIVYICFVWNSQLFLHEEMKLSEHNKQQFNYCNSLMIICLVASLPVVPGQRKQFFTKLIISP